MSPESFLHEYLKEKTGGKIDSTTAEEFIKKVFEEVRNTEDALILRCGLQAMLALRPYIRSDERLFGEEFKSSMLGLLTGFTSEPENEQFRYLEEGWYLVQLMAAYFLMYQDLEGQEIFPEPERRVAIAWWMAWRFKMIIDIALSNSNRGERLRLIRQGKSLGMQLMGDVAFKWLYLENPAGVARRETYSQSGFDLGKHFVSSLKGKVAKGFSKPERLLEVSWRDLIINISVMDATLGGGYLVEQKEEALPWLWYDPSCRTGPAFLRNYYQGSSFKFLGQERVEKIEVSEKLGSGTEPDDSVFKIWGKLADEMRLKFCCSAVYQLAAAGHGLTQWFKEKYGKGVLAGEVNTVSIDLFPMCVLVLARTMVELCRSSYIDEAEWLAKEYEGIDLGRAMEGEVASEIATYLAYSVLLGAPMYLLKCKMQDWRKKKNVINSLLGLRETISNQYGNIPHAKRDRAREVANLLAGL